MGIVASSPVVRGESIAVDVQASTLRCNGGEAFTARVLVYVPIDVNGVRPSSVAVPFVRGDEVELLADLALPQRFWNEETGDPRPREARRHITASGGALQMTILREGHGPGAWIDALRNHARLHIGRSYPAPTEAMARALVLGEGDLAPEDDGAFRTSGLAHLLAVSGMHLVLVVVTFVGALRWILVRVPSVAGRLEVGRLAAAVGIVLTWAYASFAGASGSALRAAWMLTALLGVRAAGLLGDGPRALAASALTILLLDPLAAYDVSFTLSAAATAGLFLWGPPLTTALRSLVPSFVPSFLVSVGSATTAASLACAPLLATLGGPLPLGGLAANLVAVPIGESMALPLCLVHVLLSPWPTVERGCAVVASGALEVIRRLARGVTAVPWLALEVPPPTAWELAILATLTSSLLFTRRSPMRTLAFALVGLLGIFLAERGAGPPRGLLRVTILDVGQGDSILVDLPDGTALLVDGGGLVGSPVDVGERVVAPVLRARRRHTLRAVIPSHPHPDHYLGLRRGLASVQVEEVWSNGTVAPGDGPYGAWLASQQGRGARLREPGDLCGAHTWGGAQVEVLAPCPGPTMDDSVNDGSFVLRLGLGRHHVLLVGDAEAPAEERLLHRRELVEADVLKVGHHGSRTSSTDPFLAAVRPRWAVVSSGLRNRFGHPHETTLGRLATAGAQVLRTDQVGAVTVSTDGTVLMVRTAGDRTPTRAPH